MKKKLLLFISIIASSFAFAQVDVTSTGGTTTASYTTLATALAAVDSGLHTGTISIGISANTTETVSAVLIASGTGFASYTSISISPTGGAARAISGAITGHLIDLNGAKNVTINGLNTGGNALTISNTAAGASSCIRFINDASLNTITNCTVTGSTTSFGSIFFSTGTVNGNDSNTISNNNIGVAGTNFPVRCVYSLGTSSTIENNANTISGNNIFDFFSTTAITNGIDVNTGNSNWAITNNKLYQTATRTYTTANTHNIISVTSGNGYTITGNTIGYASSAGTGVYTMAGTIATRLIGINLVVGTTTATSVQGNTVAAISMATSSGITTLNGIICGINITGGNVNVGTVTGNTIGTNTGINSIVGTSTTTGGLVVGINSSSTGIIEIQNNTIGALSSSGTTAAIAGSVTGINVSGVATLITISNNTIGNVTANNLRGGTSGLTTGSSLVSGINLPSTPTTAIINGNTIQNLSSFGTGTSGYVRGIWTATSASATAVNWSISNNTINNLTTNSALSGYGSGLCSALGIHHLASQGCVISQNTISNIANINTTATTNIIVVGISSANATVTTTLGTTISRNRIWGLGNSTIGTTVLTPPIVAGIAVRSGNNVVSILNNMISLGNAQTTNTSFIGIWSQNGSAPNPTSLNSYFNTVNIEGVATAGSLPSFAYLRSLYISATSNTITVDVRNNIFQNTRSGGTGQHFAISNGFNSTTVSATGWASGASNFNVLNANTSTIGHWVSAQTLSGWRTASSGDANSLSGITTTFTNTALGDLHLNMGTTPTQLESGGTTIASFNTDFDNQARPGPTGSVNGGAFFPDFGADEFDGVYLDLSPPTISYTPLGFTCSTGNRTLIATITDASGIPRNGTGMPVLYWKINSGTYSNVAATSLGNNQFQFVFGNGVTTNDTIYYYVVAQDSAAAPNAGTFPSVGASGLSINPPAVSTPPTTPSSYLITTPLVGNYTVGVSGNFANLTSAIAAYNTRCLTGDVTFELLDSTYTEPGTITISNHPDASITKTLTIKPASGVTSVITASAANAAVLRINGSYVTINGSNNNSNSRDLTWINGSATAPLVFFVASSGIIPTKNIAIKNCIAVNGVNTSTAIVMHDELQAVTGGSFDSITIHNNDIRKSLYGVFIHGGTSPQKATNIAFSNNLLTGTTTDAIRHCGLYMQGVNSGNISGNTIANFDGTTGEDDRGIWLATGCRNIKVERNAISNLKYSGTSGYGTYGIYLSTAESNSNNLLLNNTIADLSGDGWTYIGVLGDNTHGIFATGVQTGIKMYNNSISLLGNTINQSNALTTGICLGTGSTADIRNNIITTSAGLLAATGYGSTAIYLQSSITQLEKCDYNNYLNSSTGAGAKLIGKVGTVDYTSLTAWKVATTTDTNSFSVNPIYVNAASNLTPASCVLNNAGIVLSVVTNDFNGVARSSTPDIGAIEFSPAAISAPTATSPINYCKNNTAVSLSATGAHQLLWFNSPSGGAGDTLAPIPLTTSVGATNFYVADSNQTTGCISPRTQMVVNVNDSVTNNSITTASQTICSGSTPTALTGSTPTGGTGTYNYTWLSSTSSATSGFVAASGTNNTLNYTPSALTANTWYRRSVSSGACAADTSVALAITADSLITGNTIDSNQTMLSGSAPAGLTGTLPTGGNGTYSYLWLSSTTSATAGYSAASGTNNTQNYTPGTLTQNTWYRRSVSSGVCGADTSAALAITVISTIANNTISGASTICSGSTPSALTGSTPTGGNGTFTYTWLASTSSATSGFTAASGTNNTQDYTPSALTQNTWYRRYVASSLATDTSAAVAITVSPVIAGNTIGSNQNIVSGSTPSGLTGALPTGGNGTYTYTWLSSATSATAGYAVASGTSNAQNYTPGALTQNTWYKRLVTSGSCSDTSSFVNISVDSFLYNNNISASQTICASTAPAAFTGTTPLGGNGTSYVYIWLSSTVSATTGFVAATGTNNTQGYTPGTLTQSSWYRRVVVSGAARDTSSAVVITVNAAGTWTGAVSSAWSNAANWSCPQIPTSSTNVIINSGVPNMPVVSDLRQCNNLTIGAGATLTITGANAQLNISGTLTNNGTFVNNSNGTTAFTGSTQQTVPAGNYSKLELNNPAGVVLAGSVVLSDSLILSNGIMTLNNHDITLGNAAFASQGSANSYIKTNGSGKIIINGVGSTGKTGNVWIPVGNSTFNPVVLSNTGITDTYTIWLFDSVTNNYTGSTPIGAKLTSNALNRTWIINEGVVGGSNATVTLQWNTADEMAGFNRSLCYVARYNGTTWSSTTASAAAGSNPYTQTRTGITSFSPFGVGSGGALPVELISFEARKLKNNTLLTWQTASEINNDYFEVERSSDGITFEVMNTKVKGHGTSQIRHDYSLTDESALTYSKTNGPIIYYRLKQVDFDGEFAHSEVRSVNMGTSKETVSVQPNPYNEQAYVVIEGSQSGKAEIVVTDVKGSVVLSQQADLTDGYNQLLLVNAEQLQGGMYFINVKQGTNTTVLKLVKKQ